MRQEHTAGKACDRIMFVCVGAGRIVVRGLSQQRVRAAGRVGDEKESRLLIIHFRLLV
jgi:hypothetical protein